MESHAKAVKMIATGTLMLGAHRGYALKRNLFRDNLGIGIAGRIAR